MSLPIVCFDMDGTLLDEQMRIHPRDIALLTREDPPALFVPSTGRPLLSVRHAFAKNGMYESRRIPLHLVLQNGAVRMSPGEVTVGYDPFDARVQDELLAMAMSLPQVTTLFINATDMHVLWPTESAVNFIATFGFVLEPFPGRDAGISYCKMMCVSDSTDVLSNIAAKISSWPLESAFSMPTLLEITNKGVDKAHGVSALLREIGRPGEPIYAAGDWSNDLPLFRIAAASFAPRTAADAVKSAASGVIDVRENGLLGPILDAVRNLA